MKEKYIAPSIALFSQWLAFKLNANQLSDNVYFEYNCSQARVEHFQHIVKQLVKNHEILRYSFILKNNELKIKIEDTENIPIKIELIDYLHQVNWKERVFSIVDRALKESFDLESAPLFRLNFVRLGESHYKFIFIIPHALVDSHTLHMFYYETDILIKKFLKGEVYPELSTDDIQFTSYINEQNDSDFSPWHPSQEYWLSHFKDGVNDIYLGDKINREEVIQSKKDYEKAAKQFLLKNKIELNFSLVLLLNGYKNFRYLTYIQIVQKHVLDKMEMLARISNTTVFSIMASCYYLVIYKINQNPYITISYTLSTRNSIQKQNASGSFLNLLFVKQYINENMPAIEFIKATHQQIIQMKANCCASMPRIWHKAGLSEYNSIPLDINYFINQHDVITENISKQEGIHHRQDGEFGFDIELKAIQGTDGILLNYNYKEEFFSCEYIEEFTGSLLNLINQLTDSPYVPINYYLRKVYDVI